MMVKSMLSSKELCQKEMTDTEERVYKEDQGLL